MRITTAELRFLRIPLRLSVTHGAWAARTASDSIIVSISAESGRTGYGEAVVRQYVSGTLDGEANLPDQAVALVGRLLEPLRSDEFSWEKARAFLGALPARSQELPFLCAVETALLDLACAEAGADAYTILDEEPLRSEVTYGGVIPIVPLAEAGASVERYRGFGFREVKVKLGDDPRYNDAVLGACRAGLGPDFDIRVDANSSWTPLSAPDHLAVCARHGVRMVEQPFATGVAADALVDARARGFEFIADEGVLTGEDVVSLAAQRAYGVLNLRLAKNGGLSRVLALAAEAQARGMRYQLGCMVGETAVLSAIGRIAASLLPAPLFVEGSYDDILLTANVTAKGFGFGPGGVGRIVRGKGIGCVVVPEKLAALTVDRRSF
jgi:muconate cycloisomerase